MKKAFIILVSLFAMFAASTSLKAQEVTIVLNPGWTWISYPGTEPIDIATALGSFTPMDEDMIVSFWSSSDYVDGEWIGDVDTFYPGYGYMYYSNRRIPVTLTFNVQPPAPQVVVTTMAPTDVTSNSATSGGSIATDAYVFAKGICWATHTSPTQMDDYYSENGNGDESFTAEMTDLSQNTTYYVRAYAVTQNGIAYGDEVSFTTIPIWTIEATPNPTEGGTITGAGDYEQNAVCTLTAIANEGYIFANWTENGEVVSTDATYTFTVDAARTLVANFDLDHTYVDLGLPSGTLWATCNLGANLPEEYGDYFAWGETQPKDNFSWTNYQYCMGSFNTLTKYCNNPDIGYNGFTDDLTTLLPEDDAATANWGDDWCMPTDEEWQELYQNTTVTWTTRNGVNGRLFTASNGNSIFMPASGYCNESTPEATGIIGDYWTSSLDTDYPSGALSFFFNSSNYYIGFCNRLYGRNVRAVRSTLPPPSFIINATANPTEGGEISGSGTYIEGAECTLTATASEGYTFINWTENGNVVFTNATYSFTVTENRSLVANFIASAPTGAINGKFTINYNGGQVYFSQGNLQYIGSASTPYWKFADNQWDVLGTTTGQNSSDQNVDRDLFGWGTSGYNHGANCFQPWSTSRNASDYYVYGNAQFHLYDQTGQADWGYNPISNGGNLPNHWRTLTNAEWGYVFNSRVTESGIRYAKAKVNGVNGVILLPDDWNTNYYSLNRTNQSGADYDSNTITTSQWSVLENKGCVFLPAAGYRVGTNYSVGSSYWSATRKSDNEARRLFFNSLTLEVQSYYYREYGFAVRVVCPAE